MTIYTFEFSILVIGIFIIFMTLITFLKTKYNLMVLLNIFLLFIAMIEPSPSDILFIFIFIFMFFNNSINFKKIGGQFLQWLLLYLYIVMGIIQIINLKDYFEGIMYFTITLYLICYSFFIFLYSSKNNYLSIIRAYILGTTFSAILGILGYMGYLSSYLMYDNYRVKGLFKDPNVFGPFLVPSIILLIGDLKERHITSDKTYLNIVLIFLHTSAIIISFSRGAWVNLVLALFVYLALNIKRVNLFKTIVLSLVLLIIIYGVWTFVLDNNFKQFLITRTSLQSYDMYRFAAQRAAINLISEEMLGVGPGQYEIKVIDEMGMEISAHSLYMRLLLENGIVGFVLLLLAFSYILIKLIILHFNKSKLDILKPSILFAILFGILVNSIVIDTLHWRHFWFFVGLSLSLISEIRLEAFKGDFHGD